MRRVCKKCGVEKELDEFTKNRQCLYGFGYQCKVCHNSSYRTEKTRERNRDRYRKKPMYGCICDVCGSPFLSKRVSTKKCSMECVHKSQIGLKKPDHVIDSCRAFRFKKGSVPKNKIDLVGVKFNKLTAISEVKERGLVFWLCKCDCGNETKVPTAKLINGSTKSCGCLKHKFIDYTGKKFGKLSVLNIYERRGKDNQIYWVCQCDCGKLKAISSQQLSKGQISCGCALDEFRKSKRRFPEGAYEIKASTRYCTYLSDYYVKRVIVDGTNLKPKDIPQPLVDLKREEIKINRLLREKKNENSL